MNEKEILLSHALDIRNSCVSNSMIACTNFLSVDEISLLKQREKEMTKSVRLFYYGGYGEAERQLLVFVPDFFGIEDIDEYYSSSPDENPLCVIKVKKDRFSDLSHRDYLGALMGLGIKREMLGDIRITDEGCCLFALKSISRYICENLDKVGRGSVICTAENVSEGYEHKENTEIVFSSVASLRLDNIVSSAFNLSRSNAVMFIEGACVYVNSMQVNKKDYNVSPGDKVVLRGKGKVVIQEIIGESKKGRMHINIKKYR